MDKVLQQQVLSSEDRKKARSESKVAKATTILLLSVVICYSPLLFLELYVAFVNKNSELTGTVLYWAWLLALLNSSINPLIACRQLTILRKAVKSQFRWLLRCRRRDVQPSNNSESQVSKTGLSDMN